jgi:UDP-GlcNAc:undecaprenyl-phosphate GlcNAc-1-phosphate transferase
MPVTDIVLLSLLASAAITGLSIPIARRLGVVDKPAPLKVHKIAMPRLGGLGISTGSFLGILLLPPQYHAVLLGAVLIWVVGVLDDRWTLTPMLKLVGQGLAGLLLGYTVTVSGLSPQSLGLALCALVLTVFFSNASNLIDGLDGLAAGNAIVIFFGLYELERLHGLHNTVPLVLTSVVVGFLPWNFPKALVFLGDSGSLLLGFFVAYALTDILKASFPLFICGLMMTSLLTFDLLFGVLRRRMSGLPIFAGDRRHSYDLLAERFGSGFKAVVATYAFTTALVGLSLALSFAPEEHILFILLLLFLGLFLATRSLGWLPLSVAKTPGEKP